MEASGGYPLQSDEQADVFSGCFPDSVALDILNSLQIADPEPVRPPSPAQASAAQGDLSAAPADDAAGHPGEPLDPAPAADETPQPTEDSDIGDDVPPQVGVHQRSSTSFGPWVLPT